MSGGLKDDSNKPRLELLPPVALVEVAKVLTYGAANTLATVCQGTITGVKDSSLVG